MNDTILKIGNVDMSEHVICEAVDISTAPVYSDSFTAVNGKERKKCLGVSVSLSADSGAVGHGSSCPCGSLQCGRGDCKIQMPHGTDQCV